MKLFLDTANIDEVRKALETGLLDGLTTNPSLIAREGKDLTTEVKKMIELFERAGRSDYSISMEVVSQDTAGMLKEAAVYSKVGKGIVVKIPMTAPGMAAVKVLTAKKMKTNVTLVFSANQALLAAKAGATYVSPFIGRIDDIGMNGMELLEEIRTIYENYGYKTEILAASIRSPRQVAQAAMIGCDIATLPYKIFEQLFQHPLTDNGLKKFLEDWDGLKKKIGDHK